MASKRIRGQETEVQIKVNGAVKQNITDIRSFEMTMEMEQTSEGFLGETTERKDSIFKGATGRMELHVSHVDTIQLFQTLVDKARRAPGAANAKIDIISTLRLANGGTPRIILRDVEFGAIPLNFASRTDYGTVTLDFACSDPSIRF